MLNLPTVKEFMPKYIDAGYPILYIRTFEESKADKEILAVADRMTVLEWNGANGFVDFKTKASLIPNQTLEATLTRLAYGKELERTILVIKDAAEQLDINNPSACNSKVIALLKEIARKIRLDDGIEATIIIVSSTLHIPEALEKMTTVMELDLPSETEIREVVDKFLTEYEITAVHSELIDAISLALKGLSEFEIEDLLRLALSEDGELTKKALKLIIEQKQQIILKAGILEMIQVKESVDDIGGLENLKVWLQKKSKVFNDAKKASSFGVSVPKGVLIAGIPGCGKSLCAKAAGALFDVPLMRLDMGKLMGKYVGESEENMRKAILLAEAISPCVLWVDELEKAFAGISGGGSEVTTRLFGTFLTWMQEKTKPVFVLATANKITELPPELLRKGRFDEIFYVPLPNPDERKKIFEIHIKKRRPTDVSDIDLDALVSETEGYTGADIEGVVCESIENVFVRGNPALTTDDVLDGISNTHSLAEIMKKELDEMDTEYRNRKFKKASR